MEGRQFLIGGENDLDELCKKLTGFAGDNRIWAFYGDMGAGKTTMIRHLCKVLGVEGQVSSPTFSLVNEYFTAAGKICHFDFYRIEKLQEAIDIGCEEYFYSGALCLIEWPEKILNLLPHPFIKISIETTGMKRKITFEYGR